MMKLYQDRDWLYQKYQIEELYWKKNYSLEKCGDFFNVSGHTIMDWMIKLGIPRRRTNESKKINIKEEELERLYNSKEFSMRECGEYLGVSIDTIRKRLMEFGIVRRKCAEGRIPWNYKGIVNWVKQEQGKHPKCHCGCGEEIIVKKHHYGKGIPKFININHYAKTRTGSDNNMWKGGKIKVKCSGCGKIVEKHPSLIYRRNNRVWCKECFKKGLYAKNGEESPNWKGGPKVTRGRQKKEISFIINNRISSLINSSLKGNKAGRHWENLVGWTLIDLIRRLKKTIPQGYCWQDCFNGKLQIDHILPRRIFQFKTPEDKEFKQCWSLYNLRLLPAKENILKNANITNPILLGLLLKETKPLQLALAI